MKKPAKVRAVYLELKNELGSVHPTREILQLANSLVDLYDGDGDSTHCDMYMGGTAFDSWRLDAALADGGWRVLNSEMRGDYRFGHDDWEGTPVDLLQSKFNLEELICHL